MESCDIAKKQEPVLLVPRACFAYFCLGLHNLRKHIFHIDREDLVSQPGC